MRIIRRNKKPKQPRTKIEEVENTVVEVTRKVRTVDTRVNTVGLDRIDDEKIEELIPDNVKQGTKKQKINQKKNKSSRV